MPTYDTPEWVSADLDVISGDIALIGWDKPITEVDVRPASGRGHDVKAAEATEVDCHGGRLVIRQNGDRRSWWGSGGSIRVVVSLPTGSAVQVQTREGDLRSTGRLGDVQAKTGDGDIVLGDVGSCHARSADGDVRIGAVAGDLEVATGDGAIEVASVSGATQVNTGDGDVRLGPTSGPVRLRTGDGDVRVASIAAGGHLRTADGDITLDACAGEVDAVTSDGDLRIGSAGEGTVRLSTSDGDIVVGVASGTSAWLDLDTADGRIINELEDAGGPAEGQPIIRLHARTSSGDIVVGRAEPAEIQDVLAQR